MNDITPDSLCPKIARLVEERGWNQEEFARLANLNRLTIRNIFQGGQRRLHNATVSACARALGLTVADLRGLPLDRLATLLRTKPPATVTDQRQRLFEMATQPEPKGPRCSPRFNGLHRNQMPACPQCRQSMQLHL